MGVIGPIEAMVLRRKKLKQKLHSLFPADEAEAENLGSEAQALKERLLSSKRPRRRGGSEAPGGGGVEEGSGVEEGGEERRKERKEKRRLKEEEAAAAATDGTQKVEGEAGAETEDKEDPRELADPAVITEDR
jgi:squamous cell carcinoma antigen recognized by T-cells 3